MLYPHNALGKEEPAVNLNVILNGRKNYAQYEGIMPGFHSSKKALEHR
jgi:hypothetical protein